MKNTSLLVENGMAEKILKEEIDWLIITYKTCGDDELENESLQKLQAFGIDETQINERVESLKTDEAQKIALEKFCAIQEKNNEKEGYTYWEMIKIFLFSPYETFKFYESGLVYLWQSNYKRMFRQRLILLISGTLFYVLLFIAVFKLSDNKRMQEIENVTSIESE